MPKQAKYGNNKEVERLKGQRKKAQDKGDITEEAKICNTIGELYAEDGDHSHALVYHQTELSLSEGGGDQLGAAIAHRRIGECHCEMGNYREALSHQNKHLEISKQLGNLAEEQRALATLGRTYFVHSQSELEKGGEKVTKLLRQASLGYQRSLDVCDKLIGQISDREVLEMKSRLYLNLGLVYEIQSDTREARKFMEKALSIGKELGHSSTVFKCQFDLGSLHLREHHPSLALGCLREAAKVARDKRNQQWEAEVLREMGQAFAQLGDFENAKSLFKKAVSMTKVQLEESDAEQLLDDLRAVRKILHYSAEVERVECASERLALYDKLGDLCCGVRAFPTAVKFYGRQLSLAELQGLEPKQLSPIYVSLARTHTDCGQFSQALLYYHKELNLWKGNIIEECDTWCSIAKVNLAASHDFKTVLDAYKKAYSLAEKGGSAKRQVSLCKSVLKHCKGVPDYRSWESRLASLVTAHPGLDGETSSESEEESQPGDRSSSEPPPSPPSSESEEDDSPLLTAQTRGATTGVAVRKKSRVNKRNEKGETLLHMAAIDGNAALVKQLAKEGAEVNVRDHCGWTPLHEACNHGYLEVVRTLLDHGATINDPGGAHCGGVTPLIDAVINGHVEVVRLLVDRGADLSIRNSEGHTALSVVIEKLSSDSQYDLRDEHITIRDILKTVGRPDNAIQRAKVDLQKGKRAALKAHSRREAMSSRLTDRTGAGVLYSSDEEDAPLSKLSNPFEPFTVDSSLQSPDSQPDPSRLSEEANQTSPVSHKKGVFNPMGQVEIPALLSAEEDCEEMSTLNDLPVIDGWLVDDMIHPPPAKRTKQKSGSDSEKEGAVRLESASGRRKGSQLRNKTHSNQRSATSDSHLSSAHRVKETHGKNHAVHFEDDILYDDVMFNEDFGASVSTQQPIVNDHSRQLSSSAASLHSSIYHRADRVLCSGSGPLRVRVRIDSKSHLIPCPRRLPDGSEPTIEWLVKQATERYCAQEGVRPELTLTTLDGALLGLSDAIEHVLGPNEEVVGVVKQWLLPPLPERYEVACRSQQKQPHKWVLSHLQSHPNLATLDLSDHTLCPAHYGPLFRALQGQTSLTTLSLSGNRVKDKGMKYLTSALTSHSNLQSLDLSCTAITSQGIEELTMGEWAKLRILNLSYNSLGAASGFSIGRLLDKTRELQELFLEHCGLSSLTLQPNSGLLESVKNLSGLRSLSAADNDLEVCGVSALISALPGGLTRLNLSGTCRHTSIVQALQQSTQEFSEISKQLEALDLSHCSVKDSCLPSLVAILEGCVVLKELRLAGLFGGNVQPLCRYLSLPTLSPHIQTLDLSASRLGGHGLEQLLSALAHRRRFLSGIYQNSIKLSLCHCGIEAPLPVIDGSNVAVATNSSMFLKAKQSCSDKFVVMLELFGNNNLGKTHLKSWTQFS